ncbi:MAG: hypothetical protein H0Z33_16055 [Bacillaceae bacterium]|nr:hypothetical protein [Bacillaceae bacterium]
MYVGRELEELEDVALSDWELKELAYYHHTMSQLVPFLNQEGVAFHNSIIKEIERRGGLKGDRGAWDHSSQIIYD